MHCIFSAVCACAKKRDYTVCLNRNGATINHSFTDLLIPRCFRLKYNLDRSTAYLVRPDQGSNPWPPDHEQIYFMTLRCCRFNHLVIRDLRRVSHSGPLLILLVPLSIKYFLRHQNFIVFHLYPDGLCALVRAKWVCRLPRLYSATRSSGWKGS